MKPCRSPTRSFDVVFCDHGAMSFCDPYRTVPEVARLLRPGGRFVFAHSTPWGYITWNAKRDSTSRRLRNPYFGMRLDDSGEGTIDFHLPYGEWIRLFRAQRLHRRGPRRAAGAAARHEHLRMGSSLGAPMAGRADLEAPEGVAPSATASAALCRASGGCGRRGTA